MLQNGIECRNSKRLGSVMSDFQEYEVEAILGDRIRNHKMYYLVQWAGFPASENTWEPEENIPQPLIDAYRSQKARPATTRGTKKRQSAAPADPPRKSRIIGVWFSGTEPCFKVQTKDGNTKVLSLQEVKRRYPDAMVDMINEIWT
jgi:hypothetical protein